MRILMLPVILALLLACGCGEQTTAEEGAAAETSQPSAQSHDQLPDLEGKSIVMIVAHRDFRDEELFQPKSIFEKAGAKVTVASSSLDPAKGMLGGTVTPDILLADVKATDYDAVVFVGGSGAKEYWDNRTAHMMARQAFESGSVVGAICIAPVILANAGLLDGRKATVWASEAGRLRTQGAEYTGRDVEADGRIITANGPEAAEKFGLAVASALAG